MHYLILMWNILGAVLFIEMFYLKKNNFLLLQLRYLEIFIYLDINYI